MPAGRRAERIPHELTVHMRVCVNEPWRDEAIFSVNRLMARFGHLANSCDTLPINSNIAFDARRSSAINDGSIVNDEIVYCLPPRINSWVSDSLALGWNLIEFYFPDHRSFEGNPRHLGSDNSRAFDA